MASADDHGRSVSTCESSAVRIAARRGPSLVLVEERCRLGGNEGGQAGQVREAKTSGDTRGTTLHAHHTVVIRPVYGRHLTV